MFLPEYLVGVIGLKGSSDLRYIVRSNEDIKYVVQLAHRINLLALNAILLSRRAGSGAAGFAVIATELRSFSMALMSAMRILMTRSQLSVHVVSRVRRAERIDALMIRAHENICANGRTPPTRSQMHQIQAHNAAMNAACTELDRLLNEADETTRFGSVIARGLKIEAVYGGDMSTLLRQVAVDFSQYIDAIPATLRQIQRHLHMLQQG